MRADDALSYDKRQFAIKSISGVDTVTEEVEITLPAQYRPVDLPAPSRISSESGEYTLEFSMESNRLRAKRRYIYKSSYVEAGDYDAYKKFYNRIVKEDSRQILLKKTEN